MLLNFYLFFSCSSAFITAGSQPRPLEKEMATHPSILVWEIPWTEEPGGLESMGWQRVGHN